ncbi:hypothetical protein GALMADRAFT_276688 [Galerina marginata CBS 339.88]|uniref:G domain-containing protein n=1 Tax=Galerina marginata (strain CBS 339.88) TaxID=685588 RepID=A0A067TG23_GALM3|nr:hypothetical protein GALMADRAFT_276688 [Galerina marginata CBS 339.88]
MGPSGVGKSTIIDWITREGNRAGHGCESCTKNVSGIRISDHPKCGDRIVLIDTPGFNDTHRSDMEILTIISEWLSPLYKAQIFLSGIIYLHRISDNRMSGAHQVALRMFSELCGDNAAPHVVLATTMWDIETKEVAEMREQELGKNYWLNMIQQGACTARFENTEESAWKIINKLLANSPERMVLQLQAELEDPRRHLKDTKAARSLYVHPQTIVAHPSTINEKLDHQNTQEAGQLIQKDIVIAFMGPSGSGKSHIIDILAERSDQCAAAMLHSSITEVRIMGPTGVGKSTIIDREGKHAGDELKFCTEDIIDREGKHAGDELKFCTEDVSGIRISNHPKYGDRIVLIDTPGFNDTHRSDMEILTIISEWLSQLYKAQIFLSGIIYLHRISDNRMSGAHQVALRMFSELCGAIAAPHVVLVTTMWDIETKEVGEMREQELAKYYWLTMIQQGACTARFENTEESAWKIIDKLLANPPERMVLQVQAELEDPRRHPKDTKAARALYVHPRTILADPATINEKLDHQNTQEAGQLSPKDIVIAFMGPSGSGKSHIIDILTKRSSQRAATLHSSTTEVRSFRIENYPRYNNHVVLVDTPSFDNSEVSDLDILRLMNDWLAKRYEEKVLLSGIIYLHRVTDNRMSGTPYRNLRIFGELCGERAARNVSLITTMWDRLDQDLGKSREQSLRETFWKPMLDNGATIARFNNNEPTSAWDIIDSVISRRSKPIPLLLQEEIIDCNRSLKETHAGQELCEDLQNLLAQQKETIQILTEQATAESNPLLSADLIDECIAIREQMLATLEQVRMLQVSNSRKIALFIGHKPKARSLNLG